MPALTQRRSVRVVTPRRLAASAAFTSRSRDIAVGHRLSRWGPRSSLAAERPDTLWLPMISARHFRVRAISVRMTVAWLEEAARRNPGRAPALIARVRNLRQVARFADNYATGFNARGSYTGSDRKSSTSEDGT